RTLFLSRQCRGSSRHYQRDDGSRGDVLDAGTRKGAHMSSRANLRSRMAALLPDPLRRVASGIDDAVASRLFLPRHLSFWLRGAAGRGPGVSPRRSSEIALVDWLKRAQDAAEGGGVAAYYDFSDGWSAGYPETTGYIIVTALQAAARLGDSDLKE